MVYFWHLWLRLTEVGVLLGLLLAERRTLMAGSVQK